MPTDLSTGEYIEKLNDEIATLHVSLTLQQAESVGLREALESALDEHNAALQVPCCNCGECVNNRSVLATTPRTALLAAVIDAAIKYRDAERTIEGKVMDFSIGWAVMQPVMGQLAAAVDALRAFDAGQDVGKKMPEDERTRLSIAAHNVIFLLKDAHPTWAIALIATCVNDGRAAETDWSPDSKQLHAALSTLRAFDAGQETT